MSPQRQIGSANILTSLYYITLFQAEISQLLQGTAYTNTILSNFEITKSCGYLDYKVKVIKI